MKRVSLFLLLALICWAACKPKGGNSNDNGAKEQDSAIATLDLINTPFFYTRLKGTMGDKPITMQLMKTTPSVYRGFYSYDTSGQPITIWGNGDSGIVKIYEESIDPENERFFGGALDTSGHFYGHWHGNGTSFKFDLHTDMKDALPFAVFYATDSASLMPGNPKSPLGMSSASTIWPKSVVTADIATFVEQQITGTTIQDPQKFLRKTIDSFMVNYKSIASSADSSELNDPASAATWNWTGETEMRVVYNQWPILVVEKVKYDYTGGAHGNWGATYITMDLSKKKVLQPSDVFKPGYKEAFVPLLEKAFRAKYRIDNDESIRESLLTPAITPNDNFILTGKGVAFSYVPYEIGPYALGQVTLYIPFSEIKSWVKQ